MERKYKKIVLFNHKGGVGKTTCVFNLGCMLADNNYKVLLIDADAQCNLSCMVMGEAQFEAYYEDTSKKDQNLKSAVASAMAGKPELIKPISAYQSKYNPNLLLVPGHIDLSEYEATVSFALTATSAISIFTNVPGAFDYFINEMAKKYEIDWVIIDLNPALSALNHILFASADYFIIPTAPDIFSLMAIKTLSKILPRWMQTIKNNSYYFEDAIYPLPDAEPKFLGSIFQRFGIRSDRPAKRYENIQEDINMEIKKILIPALKKQNLLMEEEVYVDILNENNNFPYQLGEIKTFSSDGVESGKLSRPIYDVVVQKDRKEEFRKIYQTIVNKIVNMNKAYERRIPVV